MRPGIGELCLIDLFDPIEVSRIHVGSTAQNIWVVALALVALDRLQVVGLILEALRLGCKRGRL